MSDARPLGLWSAIALVVGSMIGSGVRVYSAARARNARIAGRSGGASSTRVMSRSLEGSKPPCPSPQTIPRIRRGPSGTSTRSPGRTPQGGAR